MKDMLMKKLMKSSEAQMPEAEKMGKMQALKELIAEMNSLMGGELDQPVEEMPVHKVSVMAPDKSSLMHGLEKAEDVLEGMPGKDGMPSIEEEESEDEMC